MLYEVKEIVDSYSILLILILFQMLHPIKHYKPAKQKKSKSLVSNIAMNPFVLIAIAAALAVAIFLIITYLFWFL